MSLAHSVHRKTLLELEGGFSIMGKQDMKWNVALDPKTSRLSLPKWWVASWNLMFQTSVSPFFSGFHFRCLILTK